MQSKYNINSPMDSYTQLLGGVEIGVSSLPSLSTQEKRLSECLEAREYTMVQESFLVSIS